MDYVSALKTGWGTAAMTLILIRLVIYFFGAAIMRINITYYVLLHVATVLLVKWYTSDMAKA
jgi:hypothetical protein